MRTEHARTRVFHTEHAVQLESVHACVCREGEGGKIETVICTIRLKWKHYYTYLKIRGRNDCNEVGELVSSRGEGYSRERRSNTGNSVG